MAQDYILQADTLVPAADVFVVLRQVQTGSRDVISEKLIELFSFDPDECAEILNHLPVIISKCPDHATAKHLRQQLASQGSVIDISESLTEECHRIVWSETFSGKIKMQPVSQDPGAPPEARDSGSRDQYFLMQYRRSESMRQKLLTYFQQTAREFEAMQKDYDAAQDRLETEREKHAAEKARESEKQAELDKQIHLLEKIITESEAQSTGKIRHLESALREQERRLNETRTALNAQNKTREQEKNKSAKLDDAKLKLEAELQKKNFELDDVRDTAAKLGQRLEALERECILQKSALDEKSAELEKERQQVIAMQTDSDSRFQQRNHKIAVQEKTIAEQSKVVATALQEKKELQTTLKQQGLESERRLFESEKELKMSAQAAAAANAKNALLENSVDMLEKRILQAETLLGVAQKKAEELEKNTHAFEEVKKQALREQGAAAQKISNLETALANIEPESKAENQALTEKNKALAASLIEKEAGLLAKEALLIQEQGKSAGLDQETRRLRGVIERNDIRAAELQQEITNQDKRLEQAAAVLETERKKEARTYAETQAGLNQRDKKISEQEQIIQAQVLAIQNEISIKAVLQRQVDEAFEADAQTRALHQKTINGLKQDILALQESLAGEKQNLAHLQKTKEEESAALHKDFAARTGVFEQILTELEAVISTQKEQALLFEKQSEKALSDGARELEKEKTCAAEEMAKKTTAIEKLTNDLETNRADLEAEKKKSAKLDSLQKNTESELTASKAQITLLENKLTEHKNKILEHTENFNHINGITEVLEKQLSDTQNKAVHEANLRQQFEQENESKSRMITGLQDQMRERGELMAEDKRQIAESTLALKKLDTQLRGTETNLQAENSRGQELEKNLQLKTKLAESLKDELSSAMRRHDELRAETEREGWQKDRQIDELRKSLENYAAENDSFRQQLKAESEGLANERAGLTALRKANGSLQQEFKNSMAELESSRGKQLELTESIQAHKEFFISLEALLEKKEQELKILQEAVLRADEVGSRMVNELQERSAALVEAEAVAASTYNAWEERLNDLEQKLTVHQKTFIRQTNEIERVTAQLEKERHEALCEHEELRKEVFEKNKHIVFLENELKNKTHKITALSDCARL